MEEFQPASTDGDLLPVVNQRDEAIGARPRREVHLQRLLHRAVQVCILDRQGAIWLQQRGPAKDSYPGYWDFAATGHVDPGESYDQAARRELREEVGIDAEPAPGLEIAAGERTGWEFQHLTWLRWDAPLDDFNRAEVAQMRAFTLEEIRRACGEHCAPWPLTPGVIDHLPRLLRTLGVAVEDFVTA